MTSSVNTCMCLGTKNTVLLQTAKAAVYNPGNGHRKMTIAIILDGGSQRSYVTERIQGINLRCLEFIGFTLVVINNQALWFKHWEVVM